VLIVRVPSGLNNPGTAQEQYEVAPEMLRAGTTLERSGSKKERGPRSDDNEECHDRYSPLTEEIPFLVCTT
jgi:hypothetical protein